ncbi:hypothetical protein BDP27DRAFT_1325002 [Rhodocollybia butyracea]|uniref:Uncharacterized protein n=1 Tax=Rhodocollybia butyracea TaxID=206335 RepID=A0A9P5PPM2_9AGAR|nr:hypothetical protein BDP27DRAFT_1325002 [Rhodocollybia butyracea]
MFFSSSSSSQFLSHLRLLHPDGHHRDKRPCGLHPQQRIFHWLIELAAALMPEPSAGSRLLAEEFGIEYDEGAEGIDEEIHGTDMVNDELEHHDTSLLDTPQHSTAHDPSATRQRKPKRPEQDAMEVLAQDLESTDKFLSHLRHLDNEPGSIAYDRGPGSRTFRIRTRIPEDCRSSGWRRCTDDLLAVTPAPPPPVSSHQEWDVDPHQCIPSSATMLGPPTPATTIPQLAHLRSFTRSLVTSLTTISEQAQVNGAATTEQGEKYMGGGLVDGTDSPDGDTSHLSPSPGGGRRRVDGRRIVQEHLQAFELALADAGVKTKAIMASG